MATSEGTRDEPGGDMATDEITRDELGGDQPSERLLPATAPYWAKLRPPQARPTHLDLERLLERLRSHRGCVLVVAPPGFGKTTLLSRWTTLDDRRFGWLSLDAADNDPVLFWTYITLTTRALGVAGPDDHALRVPGAEVGRTVLPSLLNELEALETEGVLVLDDIHSIWNPECLEGLALLLERLPSNITIAFSARSDPELPIGRLRVRQDLLELRAADLSFTLPETERFLNEILVSGLGQGAVRTLWTQTEGWPAGLYLAYLSMRDAQDREAFVVDFRGSSRRVVDYLTEVVVDAQDERTRDFLLRTSILDEMCGQLCDALIDADDSAEVLARLEHADLFLVPLDDRREWYRYHRLFGELLRDEMQRRVPSKVPELHRRASRWLGKAGYTGDAIRHALAGGDVETATTLVSENYLRTLEGGGLLTIESWIATFPRHEVVVDARLSVVEAWVRSFQNRYEEADLAMENAIRAGFEGPLPDGASSVEASAALLRASGPRGNVGEMLSAARTAFDLEGNSRSMWEVTTHVQLGWALLLSGKQDEAKSFLERAAMQAPMTEQWLNALGARSLLAWAELQEDRVADAERWAMDGIQMVEPHGLAGVVGDWAHATLGAVRARQGRIDEADDLLTRSIDRMRGTAPPLFLVQALLALAPVRRARGLPAEARACLSEARAIVENCSDPGVVGEQLERLAKTLTPGYRRVSGEGSLTQRELEVLQLLEKGMSKREIAQTLFLSFHTVRSHTKSIYRKLGALSRAEAIQRAHEDGIL
jgi:LuxR family transcriptional regulator, maltose regulon positive regulatory protein